MIELTPERLPIALERKLRLWLSKSEAGILRRVIVAKGQFKQADALAEANNSTAEDDVHELLSRQSMKESARYIAFLEVLDEISNQPEETPFQTAKLTTQKYADSPIGNAGED